MKAPEKQRIKKVNCSYGLEKNIILKRGEIRVKFIMDGITLD